MSNPNDALLKKNRDNEKARRAKEAALNAANLKSEAANLKKSKDLEAKRIAKHAPKKKK